MLIRIVKMSFDPEKIEDFKALFAEVQPVIKDFSGCHHVEMCIDAKSPNIMYTFSKWEDEADLENYRSSEFFESTWAKTKVLFNGKPEAYSLITS